MISRRWRPVISFGGLIWVPRLIFSIVVIGFMDDPHAFGVAFLQTFLKPVIIGGLFAVAVLLLYSAFQIFRLIWEQEIHKNALI